MTTDMGIHPVMYVIERNIGKNMFQEQQVTQATSSHGKILLSIHVAELE